MATTTKSTRKKPVKATKAKTVTKTTKTAAAKPAVKTKRAAVVTKPKATEKPVKSATVTTKTTIKESLSPLDRLRSAHLTNGLLYLIFAGLVVAFTETASKAVTLPVQTRDEFASKTNVVLGNAQEVLYNIQPKYLLAAALVVTGISSILLATKLRARYEATLAGRTSGFRWLTFGLSSAFTLSFVSLLAGITDVWVLKFSAVLIIGTAILAWIADRDNRAATQPKWLAYVASLFSGAIAWLAIVGSLIGTSLYGMERFGWEVYAIAGATLVGFTSFAVYQYLQLRPGGRQNDYVAVEQNFYRIDLLTKFAIVLLTIFAFK